MTDRKAEGHTDRQTNLKKYDTNRSNLAHESYRIYSNLSNYNAWTEMLRDGLTDEKD